MSIQVAIKHHTSYTYDKHIKVWPQILRLKPAPHSRTNILGYSLNIEPKNHFINWMQDPFGNYQARIVFPEQVEKFAFTVEVIAEMVTVNPFDFFLEESAETFPFTYDEQQKQELSPYLEIMEQGALIESLKEKCLAFYGQNTVDFLVNVNQLIYNEIDYTIRLETGVQSCEHTLENGLGSCRDSGWLLVQLLRHMGLAARFVSGYLVQLKSDEEIKDGPSGPEEDFTDLHAWAEVYIPGAGWIGLDATSGLFAGEGHIPLAATPHYQSAAPISGSTEKTNVEFNFENSVERIVEKPRVSKPYTEAQITRIDQLGHQIDEILTQTDARLTMGGEPTFVSKTDMESAQWNTAADGEDKRKMALELTHKLQSSFANGGLIHFGQGKWYPGEPIPRWQYAIYWKDDGSSIWQNADLIGNPNKEGSITTADAQKFSDRLTDLLGVNQKHALAAYEDKYFYLWEQQNLPVNFSDKDLKEASMERKTLNKLLKQGFDNPVGYVLPLRYNILSEEWETSPWKFEREQLFLIPGNSQIGLRLPLDRIQINRSKTDDIVVPPNFFEAIDHLDNIETIDQKIQKRKGTKAADDQFFKTALCVEVTDGNLHVFLPPVEHVNHFLDLVRTIETVAEELNMPIILEGYQAPYHPLVTKLVVAPDPGVVEVNVHPSTNWKSIREVYDVIFESADEVGLGTNKFMLDGKHTGTGGGNHITLGGKTPADSPLLRRPDVLRSMINFWQNHPGLSYLFSSAFIGPTSQSPRVDEGRPDIVYELEIAFKELDNHPDPPFWLVDRLFRNLLTDLTGNTHRAEFSIDKLYSPDSSTGRLGILELRGFDMPPHKEMCLVQLLLIRALFTAFWQNPYKNKLIHWGNELHNKFMMHHFVKQDMYEVVDYLNNNGLAFEKEWLDVFLDFRFPEYGSVNIKGINLKLRAALEPWIVLGEEMSSSGTARFVDSSVERLEVMVEDFNPERYKLLCNSIEVPLVKTDFLGKYVASIRYKAWAPPSALHPTIGVDTPLVFDVYDTWNDRSVGGCTYHVAHPGGRNYDTFPVNRLEAESRRSTRFWDFNHSPKSTATISTQGQDSSGGVNYVVANYEEKTDLEIKYIPISRDFPHTLDLRRK